MNERMGKYLVNEQEERKRWKLKGEREGNQGKQVDISVFLPFSVNEKVGEDLNSAKKKKKSQKQKQRRPKEVIEAEEELGKLCFILKGWINSMV